MAKPPDALPAHWRAPILDSLRAGVDYRKACGGLANYRASQALEQTDAAWAAEVAAALAEGARVRAERVAAATAQRAAEVAPQAAALQEVLRERIAAGDAGIDPVAFALTVGSGAQAIGVSGHVEASDGDENAGGHDRPSEIVACPTPIVRRHTSITSASTGDAASVGISGVIRMTRTKDGRESALTATESTVTPQNVCLGTATGALPAAEPLALAWHTTQPARPEPPACATPTTSYQPIATLSDEARDTWQRRIEEAATLAPGYFGYLLWVERKCVDGGLHAMDPQWLWHFSEFYASGKFLDVGRFGLRAAKSASTVRAIAAESWFIQRVLEPSIVGVCPVMSSTMGEAGDRFDTLKAVSRACGFRDIGARGEPEPFGYKVGGGGSAPRTIEMFDSQGHAIEFRIQPASEAGAAGFTGIAGFGDELDLWGKAGGANPASKVVRILLTRFTTQPGARLHLMSATYDRDSYHAEMIDGRLENGVRVGGGDTALRRVARLGIAGAAKDQADRARLAALHGLTDPLLTGDADPNSPNVPSWVSNPLASIEQCYALAEGNVRAMLSLYGARPDLAGGAGAWTVADFDALGSAMRTMNETPTPQRMRADGLIPIPGYGDDNQKSGSGGCRGL